MAKRIETEGGDNLGQNPFGLLGGLDLPKAEPAKPSPAPGKKAKEHPLAKIRVEVRKEKAGRGGKTVTVIRPLQRVPAQVLDELATHLKGQLGTGGRRTDDTVEIQGEHVQKIAEILQAFGAKAVIGTK